MTTVRMLLALLALSLLGLQDPEPTVDELLGPLPIETSQSLKDDHFEVALEEVGTCCPNRIVVTVEDLIHKCERRVAVEARFRWVQGLVRVAGNKALVVGRSSWGGEIVGILDLEAGRYIDELWSYGFSLSPDHRYLIFATHYPRSIAPVARRSILLLVDLAQSPEENRQGDRSRLFRNQPGQAVFPDENRLGNSANPFLADSIWVRASDFAWSPDGQEVAVFLADDEAYYHLVVVGLPGNDRSEIGVKSIQIEPADYIHPADRGVKHGRGEAEQPLRMSIHSLKWIEGRNLEVRTYPHDYIQDRFVVKVPELGALRE